VYFDFGNRVDSPVIVSAMVEMLFLTYLKVPSISNVRRPSSLSNVSSYTFSMIEVGGWIRRVG